jgi:hypothetical protein
MTFMYWYNMRIKNPLRDRIFVLKINSLGSGPQYIMDPYDGEFIVLT